MQKLILLSAAFAGACFGQCSITIASPSNGTTVTGTQAITATLANCSNVNRVEYRINGDRLPGRLSWAYSWGSTAPTYEFDYNFSFLGDGTHVLTGKVYDNTGC